MHFNQLIIIDQFFSPPGPSPDLSLYTRQLAEQMSGGDKGPSFVPESFQYMQAAVGPVGQRGPQGPQGWIKNLNYIFLLMNPNFL